MLFLSFPVFSALPAGPGIGAWIRINRSFSTTNRSTAQPPTAQPQAMVFLLSIGADVLDIDTYGNTCMHYAAHKGHVKVGAFACVPVHVRARVFVRAHMCAHACARVCACVHVHAIDAVREAEAAGQDTGLWVWGL